ncbi:MAG: hypothetical protein LAP21_07805 [Acidobacteriia bacterium]|nr:hypothetical protein [Terriglobia bacterium]
MTTATVNLGEIAAFWRNARRLYTIYSALNRTFEIGLPLCRDLEYPIDRSEPEVMDRVRNWFDQMDTHVQVWQLRQLLQSTNLQTEENLRALLRRHMDNNQNTEVDRDKIDFLMVQYFAHCAPHGLYEQQISLSEVARVLEPVLGALPENYPDWAEGLDIKLEKLNQCNSLEELQKLGALLEVRELKLALRERYFDNPCLVAFTRFNFLARRAFFRAMHLDLHAIRNAINELEGRGVTEVDCSEAGLTDHESMEHIRHVVHQWKTPFRAPYTGGASFGQLILLRHALQKALGHEVSGEITEQVAPVQPQIVSASPAAVEASSAEIDRNLEEFLPAPQPAAASPVVKEKPAEEQAAPAIPLVPEVSAVAPPPAPPSVASAAPPAPAPVQSSEPPVPLSDLAARSAPPPAVIAAPQQPVDRVQEDDYLAHCVADITRQLQAVPARKSPGVSAITLGGCKLLIATWEAEAFNHEDDELSITLRRAVAARTILHVSVERFKKTVPTDLSAAIEIAETAVGELRQQVEKAKQAENIDAAVNLAATTKRLLALIEEAVRLRS